MDSLPLVARAREHGSRVAIVDADRSYSYTELLEASARVAGALLEGGSDLREARVAFGSWKFARATRA